MFFILDSFKLDDLILLVHSSRSGTAALTGKCFVLALLCRFLTCVHLSHASYWKGYNILFFIYQLLDCND